MSSRLAVFLVCFLRMAVWKLAAFCSTCWGAGVLWESRPAAFLGSARRTGFIWHNTRRCILAVQPWNVASREHRSDEPAAVAGEAAIPSEELKQHYLRCAAVTAQHTGRRSCWIKQLLFLVALGSYGDDAGQCVCREELWQPWFKKNFFKLSSCFMQPIPLIFLWEKGASYFGVVRFSLLAH